MARTPFLTRDNLSQMSALGQEEEGVAETMHAYSMQTLLQSEECTGHGTRHLKMSSGWAERKVWVLDPGVVPALKNLRSWVWWCTPVIPAFGRLRQENGEFQCSLGCIVRP
jgi:hypothetical protein